MTDTLEHIDLAALAELREVMEDEFPLLIDTFLRDSGARLAQIRQTLHLGDPEEFSRACHSFKGSCINIGVPRLAEFCKQGELMGRTGNLDDAPSVVHAIEEEYERVQELLPQHLS